MNEHITEVVSLLGVLFFLFVGVAGWIWNNAVQRVTKNEDELQKVWKKIANIEVAIAKIDTRIEQELYDMKTNYTDRFDDVKDTMNKNHNESKDLFNSLKIAIEKQSQFCYLIQEQKKGKL